VNMAPKLESLVLQIQDPVRHRCPHMPRQI
jgi:hypothetical protein